MLSLFKGSVSEEAAFELGLEGCVEFHWEQNGKERCWGKD